MGANMTVDRLKSTILEAFVTAEGHRGQSSRPVTCELMTHPGQPTSLDYGGFSWGTDDFGSSNERVTEIQVLCTQDMLGFYKDNNIELISHKDL